MASQSGTAMEHWRECFVRAVGLWTRKRLQNSADKWRLANAVVKRPSYSSAETKGVLCRNGHIQHCHPLVANRLRQVCRKIGALMLFEW